MTDGESKKRSLVSRETLAAASTMAGMGLVAGLIVMYGAQLIFDLNPLRCQVANGVSCAVRTGYVAVLVMLLVVSAGVYAVMWWRGLGARNLVVWFAAAEILAAVPFMTTMLLGMVMCGVCYVATYLIFARTWRHLDMVSFVMLTAVGVLFFAGIVWANGF